MSTPDRNPETIKLWEDRLRVSHAELSAHVDEIRSRPGNFASGRNTVEKSMMQSKRMASDMMAFLVEYQRSCILVESAKSIGVTPRTVRYWRDTFPMFAEVAAEIQESIVDEAEDELYRRAVIGDDKNVYHQGVVVDVIKEKSNELLKFMLTANRSKFKNKSEVAMTGPEGGPVQFEDVAISSLREKLAERMRAKRSEAERQDLIEANKKAEAKVKRGKK